jgi:hypothetical protein
VPENVELAVGEWARLADPGIGLARVGKFVEKLA